MVANFVLLMNPGIYNIPPSPKGDTFYMRSPIQYLDAAMPINITGARFDMWVREKNAKGKIYFKWSTTTGEIEIVDAVEGKFKVNPQLVDIPAGRYYYDIQMTLNGKVGTYLAGYWDIIEDSSK